MRSLRLLAVVALFAAACAREEAPPSAPTLPPPPVGATATVESPTPTAVPATPTPEPVPIPTPQVSRPPGEVVYGNRDRPEMALTFDCGASGVPTPAILDALSAAGVRATFFLTGRWVVTYPDLARRIAAEHEVANHSWSHPDFRELSDAEILAEMERAEEAVQRATGVSTRPLWRAPFGSRDTRILRAVAAAGWTHHVFWSADSGDWLDISPQQVRANVARAAANGALIVQHCGSTQTAAVLPEIIRDLKDRGFRLVTVTELLRD